MPFLLDVKTLIVGLLELETTLRRALETDLKDPRKFEICSSDTLPRALL